MHVVKRNGQTERVMFDKISNRIKKLCWGLDMDYIDPAEITIKVINGLYNHITTKELDNLAAETAAYKSTQHPDYGVLAARIAISNLHKETKDHFSDVVYDLYHYKNPLVTKEFYELVMENKDEINSMIDKERDYLFSYFGYKTLEKSYLMKIDGVIVERPGYMFMRVALGIHGNDLQSAMETYNAMSQKYFTHASPTLFNAGTPKNALASCYLIDMESDSIDGIFNTLKTCAHISKMSGGIGLNVHKIRAKGSYIAGTNGQSDGLIPMLKVYNDTARYINQGGRRPGSFAIYLEPWHADVFDFLEMKKNTGKEENRARDLFYAMWIPDLFMKRVESDGVWSLMCPHECPGLDDVWGEEFEELYTKYEREGKARKAIKAQSLWKAIIDSQIETGGPYLLYKDAVNSKTNHQNLGTIKSSNLCVAPETFILTDKGQKMIGELEGQSVNIWNGYEWSNTSVVKTNTNVELIKVILSNGAEIECTPYHKFILADGETRIDAQNLKKNMKLTKFESIDNIEGSIPFKYAYTHGLFCADGTYNINGTPRLSLYDKKKQLINYIDIRRTSGKEDSSGRINIQLPFDLPNKFDVPMNSSVNDKLRWLEGYLDGDGCVCRVVTNNKTSITLQVSSINKPFLNNVRLMLQTLGVESVIRKNMNERQILLPDGKGGKKMFDCKELFRLQISTNEVSKLKTLGFSPKRLDIMTDFSEPNRNAKRFITVENIIYTKRISDTYCVNEPLRHSAVFNGILTGNCTEICEYTAPDEVAVCNLASIALPMFVKNGEFNFDKLLLVTQMVTRNLNKIIDLTYYPVEQARKSNLRHRPIGIGVQGLADTFIMMGMPFDSPQARELNKIIFETIYYGAMKASCELAKEYGPYETFYGSPVSKGIFQFDMWGITLSFKKWNWEKLKIDVYEHGVRNSLLVAPMPTASTSQILGFTECFEPMTSNIYSRRVLSGEFVVVNQYLINDLTKLNLWNESIRNEIIRSNGSIQNIREIPSYIKNVYKTVWEISQKVIIDMAADRGAFIDQSQSMNIHIAEPNYAKLSSMHFYGWKKGLKTGSYYIRTQAASQAIKFTIENNNKKEEEEGPICRKEEGCIVCSA